MSETRATSSDTRRIERLLNRNGRADRNGLRDQTGTASLSRMTEALRKQTPPLTSYPVTPKMNRASFNEPAAIARLEPSIAA